MMFVLSDTAEDKHILHSEGISLTFIEKWQLFEDFAGANSY